MANTRPWTIEYVSDDDGAIITDREGSTVVASEMVEGRFQPRLWHLEEIMEMQAEAAELADLKRLRPMEESPKDSWEVLIHSKRRISFVGFRSKGDWFDSKGQYLARPYTDNIGWTPLPVIDRQ